MLVEQKEIIHIEIRNFGIFDVKKSKSRTNALNPRTKEKIIIPSRKRITFKPQTIISNFFF